MRGGRKKNCFCTRGCTFVLNFPPLMAGFFRPPMPESNSASSTETETKNKTTQPSKKKLSAAENSEQQIAIIFRKRPLRKPTPATREKVATLNPPFLAALSLSAGGKCDVGREEGASVSFFLEKHLACHFLKKLGEKNCTVKKMAKWLGEMAFNFFCFFTLPFQALNLIEVVVGVLTALFLNVLF